MGVPPPSPVHRPPLHALTLAGLLAIHPHGSTASDGGNRIPSPPLRLPAAPASGLEPALGALRFTSPVALATPPGETNRLFVVEQPGRIIVITNLANPTRTIFLDLTSSTVSGGEQGLLGLAFHPNYATNGRFFVFRTLTATTAGNANRLHDRLSEFRASAATPHRADPTEKVLFQQYDQASNHNGGDLHFGPDGFLYVSLGDEGGANDQYGNGQTITRDFFAGLLRLDVDQRADSLPPNPHPANQAFLGNYRVPADNPYVGAATFLGRPITDPSTVRTEFFAVGLRNPWRFSFDPGTGELWIGDVGQNARESVVISGPGANHGWPFREGPIAGPRSGSAPPGFSTDPTFRHTPPLHSYSHGSSATQGRSITGGVVYRGSRYPELVGAYVYADYVSGNVWALRRTEGGGPPQVQRLLGETGISAFGTDPRDGDILIADLDSGRILKLVPGATDGQPLPATLSDTGAFTRTETLEPAAGVVPYEVNLPFWSDGAVKQRWFHVPGSQRLGFTPTGPWLSPTGSVWVKHFELPLSGLPGAARRRVETRFLVRNKDGVYGITYRWNSATNAVLVPDEGEEATFEVQDPDGPRQVRWRFPSRAECLACHNAAAGGVLSFTTAQLARPVPGPDGSTLHQVQALANAGYLLNPPSYPDAFYRHPDPTDPRVSIEARVRSYLEVNCAPCHRPGGTLAAGFFDARLETPTDLTSLILGPLNDTPPGEPPWRVIVPGNPERSMLLHRTRSAEGDRMPPISSGVIDDRAVALLQQWIAALPSRPSYDEWRQEQLGAGAPSDPDLQRDEDADGASDYLEFLSGSDPRRPGDGWGLRLEPDPSARPGSDRGPYRLRFVHPANTRIQLEATTDLGRGAWEPWAPPGTDLDVPTEDTTRDLPLPGAGEAPSPARRDAFFLRARLARP